MTDTILSQKIKEASDTRDKVYETTPDTTTPQQSWNEYLPVVLKSFYDQVTNGK